MKIAELRLANQQISQHQFKKPRDLVAWMGAMQAQDHRMSELAVALRLPTPSLPAVEKALDRGEIIRTHILRPTWHLVSALDVRWMLDLTAPHIIASSEARRRQLELTPAVLKKSLQVIESALAEGAHLTRDALIAILEKNKVATDDQRAAHILLWAELEKLVCSGIKKEKRTTYALFDHRVKAQKKLSRDEALVRLATRYFDSHGPATAEDFGNWSGLPRKDIRFAMDAISGDFNTAKAGGQTYCLRNAKLPAVKNTVFLLPAFDEFIIGYKDRSACLLPQHKSAVISVNGIFWPVIVVNGKVRGLWKRTIAGKQVKVDLNFFDKAVSIKPNLQKLLDAAAAQTAGFLRASGS